MKSKMSKLILGLVITVIGSLGISSQALATDYYISPTGNDSNDGLSDVTPVVTFVHAHALMASGDTLYLMNGTYTEQLYPPAEDSGSQGSPTSFIAVNRLQAVIAPTELRVDQETSGSLFVYSTNSATTHDMVFDGIMVEGLGERAAISIRSADNVDDTTMTHDITVKNCGAFGSAVDTNNAGSTISLTKDSLFEDCFFFGFGRYALSNYATHAVTLRRIILRFDWWEGDSYKADDPRDGMAFYNVEDGIGENIIVMDMGGRPSAASAGDMNAITVGGNDTGLAITGTSNTKLLGSIFYNNYDPNGSVNGLMLNGGSGAAGTPASPGDTHDVQIYDLVISHLQSYGIYVYNNIVNVDIDNVTAMHSFTGIQVNGSPQQNVEGVTIDNSFTTDNSNRGIVWDAGDTTPTNLSITNCPNQSDIEAAYAPTVTHIPRNTPVAGHERGADASFRYVDGIKTATPLFPWTDEGLVKSKLCDAGYLQEISTAINAKEGTSTSYSPGLCASGKSITQYIWEGLGNDCPNDVCNATGPTRSAGAPIGEQLAGTTSVTLTVITDVPSTCTYGVEGITGVAYPLANSMADSSNVHTATINGLTNGSSYSRSIRCAKDSDSEANDTDLVVHWSIANGSTEIRADVDQNSTINSTDAMLTLRNSLGLDMSSTSWQASSTTGDVNCNGNSNSTDAMLILRQSLGLDMGGTGWCGS